MGTSRTAAELTGKIEAAAKNTQTLTKSQLSPVAKAMQVPMLSAAAGARLHPGSMIAKKPWRGTYVRTEGSGFAVGYAKGAVLVDQPSRAHIIRPRKAGGTKNQYRATRKTGVIKKSAQAVALGALFGHLSGTVQEGFGGGYSGRHGLNIKGVGFRAFARHPGTKGKHFFDRSKVPTQQAASKEMRRQQATIVAKAFK